MDPELQRYLKTLAKLGILVMALVAIYLLFTYVFPIIGSIFSWVPVLFLPFIVALILAVIIEPVVNFFEVKVRLQRSWSVVLSLALVVGGSIYIVSLAISKIIQEITRLYPRVIKYSDQIINRFITSISDIRLFYLQLDLPPQVQEALQGDLESYIQIFRNLMESSINYLVEALTMLPGVFIFLLIATVATYFIIKDRALLKTFILQYIPGSARSKTREVFAKLFKALIGFVKAYSILISITAVVTMVSLAILGIEYVLTIGIIVGLLDILPILGPGTLFIPWIIWEFITGNVKMGVCLLVLYVTISVVRQFLEPKIVGDNIGLHPLATLVSLYVGLKLGGIVGMILGPVLLVILLASYKAGLFEGIRWRKDI